MLDANEVEVKALADEGDEHGKEDKKQRSLWSEANVIARDCFTRAHVRVGVSMSENWIMRRRESGRNGFCGDPWRQ